jgi:hypothetical protein
MNIRFSGIIPVMHITTLTATHLSRNFSEYLNQVRYQGASFDIQRGVEVVARLCPATSVAGYPIDQLSALFAALPQLDESEAQAMLDDIHTATHALRSESDPWGL